MTRFFSSPPPPAPATSSSPYRRMQALMGVFVIGLMMIAGRLWYVAAPGPASETEQVQRTIARTRAELCDCRGVLLATNLKTVSVYANPRFIASPGKTASQLHRLFPHINPTQLTKRLSATNQFVWVARHITPAERKKFLDLGIPGVFLMEDQRRVYPHGSLFSHVVGFTNVDMDGISGLEKGLDQRLRSSRRPVALSLDMRLQHILHKKLQSCMDTFQTDRGHAILIRVKTGEILAMVSLPDFNPHLPQHASKDSLFNRNTTGVYEVGSLLKIHNTAMLLKSKLATLRSIFDASTPLRVGRFQITDFRGQNRPLTVADAFLHSSNIANAKMALLAGIDRQKKFFADLGFFDKISLELPESAAPLMPRQWTEPTLITASYGYGFAVTPLHVIRSISAIVSGVLRPVTLLKTMEPPKGKQVLSPQVSEQIRFLLTQAAMNGQAKKATVNGYLVGAKTGTANLLNAKGTYVEKQNMTSCIAILPADDPEYILLVTVERPKPNAQTYGYATAGWIAAPLVSDIFTAVGPVLGLSPLPKEQAFELIPAATDLTRAPDRSPRPPLLLTTDALLNDL